MLKNHQYTTLLIGQSVANLGDIFYTVAIISLIYRETGSAFYASFVTFTMTISIFIAGILTPVVLNKIQLNRVLTSTQFFKTLLLFFLWAYLVYAEPANYFTVIFFFVCISFLDGFANPIKQSLIPYYVKEEELMKANSLAESVNQVMQIANWIIGGSLLLWFSSTEVIFMAFGLYVAATVCFTLLKKVHVAQKEEAPSLITQTTEGFSLFLRDKKLRKLFLIDCLDSIAAPVWNSSILLVFVAEMLQENTSWWGLINAAFFAGMILVSILLYRFDVLVQQNLTVVMMTGVAMIAVSTLFFGYTTLNGLALVSSFLVGIGTQLKNIPLVTVFQQVAPKDKLPVLYAAEEAVLTPFLGVASLAAGFIVDQTNVSVVYLLSAVCLSLMGILCYQLFQFQEQKQLNR